MKKILPFIIVIFMSCNSTNTEKTNIVVDTSIMLPSQKNKKEQEMAALEKPYNPNDNAELKIDSLIKVAKSENKRIVLQAGGNWCIWCLRFDKFRKGNTEIMELLDKNFLYYHLNYSKENENAAVFAKYKDPGQYGYPVFIILEKDGSLLHVQESGSLEEGGSYNAQKVLNFFNLWKIS